MPSSDNTVEFLAADLRNTIPGELIFLAPPEPAPVVDLVTREVKYELPRKIPRGQITEQVGPARTGKTERANAWMADDPENRRVVDGDRKEAQRLADQGYAVILNLLPGM